MIFGADVTHAADGKGNSIAAVVATMDSRFIDYRCAIRMHEGRKEIIEDLHGMATELMKQFQEGSGGRLPARIIFYRDGVSDGEKGTVVKHEVRALKKACEDLGGNAAITFMCVTKRHHVRFFPSENNTGVDKNGNLLAGTVVDTGIPFLLISKASLTRTSTTSS
jgi:eukaryotic translation initiation factor 2C